MSNRKSPWQRRDWQEIGLANEILFGKLEHGGRVKVTIGADDEPVFEIEPTPPREGAPAAPASARGEPVTG